MDQTDLVVAVGDLTAEVSELAKKFQVQQKILERVEKVSSDTRANRIGLQVATVGIVLILIVIGFVAWLFVKLDATTEEVRKVQERTSSEILCPLYQVFALSIKANPPSPNLTPEQAKARQNAADTILAGLDKLGCTR